MEKYEIINALGRARTDPRYLEICTPTTGMRFTKVDPAIFPVRHRLLYRCPPIHHDGLEITFRTANETSHDLTRALQAADLATNGYDVIFVDPFHTYFAGITDLMGALCLLRPGGVLVVHDCNPDDPATVAPDFRPGTWCGVTYQAFIDFVLATEPAGYYVIDSDYGCAVVHTSASDLPDLPTARPTRRQVFEWTVVRETPDAAYAHFARNRRTLLNLVTPADFAAAYGLPTLETAPNLLANPCWNPGSDGWQSGDQVDVQPVEILEGASVDGPTGRERRGILLQGGVIEPGIELDALWPTPSNPAASQYGPTFAVEAHCEYTAELHALPRVGALQLLLLFMDEHGAVIHSPRCDVRPRTAETGAPEWRRLTVTSRAPGAAVTATILLRLINIDAAPIAVSALAARAVFARRRPAPVDEARAVFRLLGDAAEPAPAVRRRR